MLLDNAERAPALALRHAALLADADGIEEHDKLAAVAEDVNVRPMPALVASVNPDFKSADYTLRHGTIIPNQLRFIKKRHLVSDESKPVCFGDGHGDRGSL